MSTLNDIDFEKLPARELLRAVDRSDPQVRALASWLESYMTFTERLKARILSPEVTHDSVHTVQP